MENNKDFGVVLLRVVNWSTEDENPGHRPAFHLIPRSDRAKAWLKKMAERPDNEALRTTAPPHRLIKLSNLNLNPEEKGKNQEWAIRVGKTYTALSISIFIEDCTTKLDEMDKRKR